MIEVTRILLENYSGIKTATGLDLIEINRENSNNVLCIIIGANGSGKTTIMNEITPVPFERVQNRGSSRIIDGKIGRKEIDFILDKKYKYFCKFILEKSKTHCFFKKINLLTGEDCGELNPNGNVSSYMDILATELGWTKQFNNVGYLSSKVTHIVGMKPQERNDYLSVWLEHLKEFLDAYRTGTKKYNLIKRQVNMLTSDIGKLSMVDYELKVNNYNSTVESLEKKVEELSNIISTGETYLQTLPEITKIQLSDMIASHKNDVAKHNTLTRKLIEDAKQYSKYIGSNGAKKLLKDTQDVNKQHAVLEEKLKSINSNVSNIKNTLDEMVSEVNDEDVKKLLDVENILNGIENDKQSTILLMENMIKEHPELTTVSGYVTSTNTESFIKIVEYIKEMSDFLPTDINGITLNKSENLTDIIDQNIKKLELIDSEIKLHEEAIQSITNQIYFLENIQMDESILKKRPSVCKMKCGIIDELMTMISPQSTIQKLKEELLETVANKAKTVSDREELINNVEKIKTIIDISDKINHTLFKNSETFSHFPEYIVSILKENIQTIVSKIPFLMDNLKSIQEYLSLRDKYNTLYDQEDKIKTTEKLLRSKVRTHKKYNEILSKYNRLIDEKRSIEEDYSDTNDKIKLFSRMNELIEENNKLIEESNKTSESLESERKNLNDLAKMWYYREHIIEIVETKSVERHVAKLELVNNRKELDVLNAKISSKKTLIETRDKLVKEMDKIDILLKVWSPKIGYPAWEMEDFLDRLTIQTNKDLAKMWGSNLIIEQFKIGANEFSIIINRNGTIIKDASECSDGEIATLSLAISFAIIEINLKNKKYNLIRLDETDSVLDQERRRGFLETILDRIDSLECGNIWAISHNNEFDTVNADIIALNGADLSNTAALQNKNIVFNLKEYRKKVNKE